MIKLGLAHLFPVAFQAFGLIADLIEDLGILLKQQIQPTVVFDRTARVFTLDRIPVGLADRDVLSAVCFLYDKVHSGTLKNEARRKRTKDKNDREA